MILKKIKSDDIIDFEFVQKTYIESFPPEERRHIALFQHLMDEASDFTVNVLCDDEKRVGFITNWQFNDFIFAEHFAISEEYRNGGYGQKSLDAFLTQLDKPLIIEVELPTEDIAKRRINFYKRAGFKSWSNIPYEQPAYDSKYNPVPMMLMSFGNIDVESNSESIIKQIHAKVYNKNC